MANFSIRDMVKVCENLEKLKNQAQQINMCAEPTRDLLYLENLAGKIGTIIDKGDAVCLVRFYSGGAYVLPTQSLTPVEQNPWESKDEKEIESNEFIDSYIPRNVIWPMQQSLKWDDHMDQQIKKFFPHTQILRYVDDRYRHGKYMLYKCTQLLEDKKPHILNYLKLLNVNPAEYEQNDQKYYSLFHEVKRINFSRLGSYGEAYRNEIILRDELIEDVDGYENPWFRLHLYCSICLASIVLFHELFHYLTLSKQPDGNTPKEAGQEAGQEAGYYGEFTSFGGFIAYNSNKIDARIQNIFFWKAKKELNPKVMPFRSEIDNSMDMSLVDCKVLDTSFCIDYYHNYNGNSDFWNKFDSYLSDPLPYVRKNSAKPKFSDGNFFPDRPKCGKGK